MRSISVDCLGDSITASIVSPSYPRLLKEMFTEAGLESVQVNNRGKNGFTVADFLEFFQNSKQENSSEADFYLILLGSNDTRSTVQTSLQDYEKTYRRMIQEVQRHASDHHYETEILLGKLPPYYGPVTILWQGEKHTFDAAQRISDELNPCIEKIAADFNLRVVDLYSPMSQMGTSVYQDGIHPNKRGNGILARIWFESLLPLVRKSLEGKSADS
ncbi:MAG: SGNH/GDSL hydrolase family protein [bacterium]